MIDAHVVRAELGLAVSEGVELISDYQPSELPTLLSDCTAGAFPSYVEGFGLAVLEQLAAGIPTVAYDTAGPRDLLAKRLPNLLVPSGDIDRFASALCEILLLSPDAFAQLSRKGVATAAEFSWPEIARQTLDVYRDLLENAARPIVFVQPFSLGSAGGGAASCAPCLAARRSRGRAFVVRRRIRKRGARKFTCAVALPGARWNTAAWPDFRKHPVVSLFAGFQRLQRYCLQVGARAIHAVPHGGLDFAEAHSVARALSLPFFISLHDRPCLHGVCRSFSTRRRHGRR